MNSQTDQQTEPKPGESLAEETIDTTDPVEQPSTGISRRARTREREADRVKRVSEERLRQACEMAEELRHKKGCPEEGAKPGEADRRVEHYTATKPRTPDEPAHEMLIVRCVECGEEEVARDESERRR